MNTLFLVCLTAQIIIPESDQTPVKPSVIVKVDADPAPPAANPPAGESTPQYWNLRDSQGKMWSHKDRSYLWGFVAGRNHALAEQGIQPVQTQVSPAAQPTVQASFPATYQAPVVQYQTAQPRACRGASLQSMYYVPQR